MSVYKFYTPSSGKYIVSNQAQFDEESFPSSYRNQDMISRKIIISLDENNNFEILSVDARNQFHARNQFGSI